MARLVDGRAPQGQPRNVDRGCHTPDDAARRNIGPGGIALTIVIVMAAGLAGPIVGAGLALAWARWTRTPWSTLGLVRPRRWLLTLAGGTLAGIVFKLAMKALVMPLLGAPPLNAAYRHLEGNAAALPGIIATILVSAAISEEVLYRGFLLGRLESLLGTTRIAATGSVLLGALLFGAAHLADQGWPGALQAAITGSVFGTLFLRRRELGPLIVMHAAFDLTAVVLIYRGWETAVATVMFR